MTKRTILFSSNAGDITNPVVDSIVVTGSTLLTGAVSGAGLTAALQAAAPAVRFLPLTSVKDATGLPLLTETAASSVPGISRSDGSSLFLTGVDTSGASPATTNMLWEFDLPDTYVAGANIPVLINCVVPIATYVTAASTTMTVAAYSEVNGVETALTVSAAQRIALTTATTLTFTITGTGLIPGARLALLLTALVTTTLGGASAVNVNSVGFSA